MGLVVTLLRDIDHGGQPSQPDEVAQQLLEFIQAAKTSLHLAIYEFRLNPQGKYYAPIVNALSEKAQAGIDVRIAYDHGKPQGFRADADPAPMGTQSFLEQAFKGSKVQSRAITDLNPTHADPKLMHSKYIVRDGMSLWTGSVNLNEDAWTFQENNIVQVDSSELSSYFETDFEELWSSADINSTGQNDFGSVPVEQTMIDVAFSPGEGITIDMIIANLIASAKRRIKLASMLIASRGVLTTFQNALRSNQVRELNGIYDSTQMQQTLENWRKVPHNAELIPMFQEVSTRLASKTSITYSPEGKHNFMHNKVCVIDDVVFTGSYNLSHSAIQNAENILIVHNAQIADQYGAYIDQLVAAYGRP